MSARPSVDIPVKTTVLLPSMTTAADRREEKSARRATERLGWLQVEEEEEEQEEEEKQKEQEEQEPCNRHQGQLPRTSLRMYTPSSAPM